MTRFENEVRGLETKYDNWKDFQQGCEQISESIDSALTTARDEARTEQQAFQKAEAEFDVAYSALAKQLSSVECAQWSENSGIQESKKKCRRSEGNSGDNAATRALTDATAACKAAQSKIEEKCTSLTELKSQLEKARAEVAKIKTNWWLEEIVLSSDIPMEEVEFGEALSQAASLKQSAEDAINRKREDGKNRLLDMLSPSSDVTKAGQSDERILSNEDFERFKSEINGWIPGKVETTKADFENKYEEIANKIRLALREYETETEQFEAAKVAFDIAQNAVENEQCDAASDHVGIRQLKTAGCSISVEGLGPKAAAEGLTAGAEKCEAVVAQIKSICIKEEKKTQIRAALQDVVDEIVSLHGAKRTELERLGKKNTRFG